MVKTEVTCSDCEKKTTVPFKPTKGRPVYCKECYEKRKKSNGRGRRNKSSRSHNFRRSSYPGYNPEIHASDQF